jgi:hypothetical protein
MHCADTLCQVAVTLYYAPYLTFIHLHDGLQHEGLVAGAKLVLLPA